MGKRAVFSRVEVLQERVKALQQQAQAEPQHPAEILPQAMTELLNATEELRVAEEELRQQNEKLANSRQALEELRQRYQDLFQFAPDAYLVTDLAGKIEQANLAAAKLFGVEPHFLAGKALPSYVSDKERAEFRTRLNQLPRLGQVPDWEINMLRRAQDAFPAWVSVAVEADTGEKPKLLRWVIRDLTERKRTEEELLKTRALESIGTLAGRIAHDLRNHLTAIMGAVSLAQQHCPPSDKAYASLMEASRAARLAQELSERLLTFAGGGAPILKPVSLSELIQDTVSFALSGSKLKCEFSLPQDLWPAEADRAQISQVITNLVRNAEEAMPQGGMIEVSAQNVAVDAEHPLPPLAQGRYVRVSIRDHGRGIPPEDRKRIFDPCFSTKPQGSGLGLPTAHSIIAKHGGRITVDSLVGVGTTLSFYLPASEQAVATPEPPEAAGVPKGSGKVLFMDDEPLIRVVVIAMLEELDYQAAQARDGAEAIELYRKARAAGEPFDAVILDLTVPGGMGGKEAAARLRQLDPEAKLIVSSGYASDPIMANYQDFGFCAAVPKPYTLGKLGEVLREVLEVTTTKDAG